MTVTLIMPVYNEAADLPDVLASLASQSYPHHLMTLIVVDGGSTDGSRDVATRWMATSDIAGTVLHNPRRTIPTSLNAAIATARVRDVIVRLDAHTTYDARYVECIVEAFNALPDNVACVGGPQRPMPEKRFDRALVAALYTNAMGLGGAEFRRAPETRRSRGVYLGAWRPGILQAAGGYDEAWEANEDAELAARLRQAGYETYLIAAHSQYRVKRGPAAALRQWGSYGFWRAQTLRRHPKEWRARHLVPPLAFLTGAGLLLTPARVACLPLFVAYCACVLAKRAPGESSLVSLASCVFFPLSQIAWSIGLLRGLVAPRRAAQFADVRKACAGVRIDHADPVAAELTS